MLVFVDESGRTEAGGIYVVAAVAIRVASIDRLRTRIRAVPPSPRRIHWRHEAPNERVAVLELLATEADVAALWSFETCPCPVVRQERARRKSLELLALAIHGLGGGELVIESRQERNDRKDRQLFASVERSGLVDRVFHQHQRPAAEPGLWLADCLAGAVSGSLAGLAGREIMLLADRLQRQQIVI